MIDFAAWKEKPGAVTTLQLDSLNNRIPTSGALLEQRDLIAELVEHENVYDLARDIAEHGYSPVEALIGVVEDAKSIIIEGNRRLAALKMPNATSMVSERTHRISHAMAPSPRRTSRPRRPSLGQLQRRRRRRLDPKRPGCHSVL